jgi:hypothetical protein
MSANVDPKSFQSMCLPGGHGSRPPKVQDAQEMAHLGRGGTRHRA